MQGNIWPKLAECTEQLVETDPCVEPNPKSGRAQLRSGRTRPGFAGNQPNVGRNQCASRLSRRQRKVERHQTHPPNTSKLTQLLKHHPRLVIHNSNQANESDFSPNPIASSCRAQPNSGRSCLDIWSNLTSMRSIRPDFGRTSPTSGRTRPAFDRNRATFSRARPNLTGM